MTEIYPYLVGLSGTVVMLLLAIIGWFINRLIADVKKCIEDTGINKGRIDLIAQQQENDIKRIEENTQNEIKLLAKNVDSLSTSVGNLVSIIAESGLKNNHLQIK